MNLIFDIDDTLYDLMEPFAMVHREMFSGQTDADVQALFLLSRKCSDIAFEAHARGEITYKQEFAYRIRETYRTVGIPVDDDLAEVYEKRYRECQKKVRVPAELRPGLDAAASNGAKMGILSNGRHQNQFRKIGILGLFKWFPEENIFITEDIGVNKPDPKAFEHVQKALDLAPQEIWYIGDTYENDIVPPSRLGWHTLWLNRYGKTIPEGGYRPEVEVHSYKALAEWLAEVTACR